MPVVVAGGAGFVAAAGFEVDALLACALESVAALLADGAAGVFLFWSFFAAFASFLVAFESALV
jgi:hypothetical protein